MKPRLMTTGFLRASRSVEPATKSCGRYQLALLSTASSANQKGSVVSLLMKRGRIVVAEMKLMANQKKAPSSRLAVKFHR